MRVLPILLLLLVGCAGDITEPVEFDLEFNRCWKWEPAGWEARKVTGPETDNYWIDSFTADAEGHLWYTPEQYNFQKGDLISAVTLWINLQETSFIRYDGFYFCGEENWRNYIAYGSVDFGTLPNSYPEYIFYLGIFYDTSSIRDRFLPIELDWASRFRLDWGTKHGGLPLSGRPDCFTITK